MGKGALALEGFNLLSADLNYVPISKSLSAIPKARPDAETAVLQAPHVLHWKVFCLAPDIILSQWH